MDRFITVKGKGRLLVSPDYVRISMGMETKDKEYNRAMEKAAEKVASLSAAMTKIGFEENDIKTSDFRVRTTSEYKRVMGHSKEVDTGFKVEQQVRLEFDLDLGRLADVLAVISQWSKAEPNLSVDFTIKDPTAVRDAVLRSAAVNARRQAETLCGASGVKLGNLIRVDYSWADIELRSAMTYITCCDSKTVTRDTSLRRDAVVKMRPDDIDVKDSATFIWEIE